MVFENYGFELVVCLYTGELELLNDVRDLFESMLIFVLLGVIVRYHQESRALEKNDFVGVERLVDSLQVLLQGLDIWQKE